MRILKGKIKSGLTEDDTRIRQEVLDFAQGQVFLFEREEKHSNSYHIISPITVADIPLSSWFWGIEWMDLPEVVLPCEYAQYEELS